MKTSAKRKDKNGRILEKGETYQSSFDRYRYTYTSYGKRYSIFAKTLKELREREDEIRKKYYLGMDVANPKITVNEVFEICMATKINIRESSREKYIGVYNRAIRNTIGNRPISSLRFDDIHRLYLTFVNNGRSYNYLCAVNLLIRMCFKRALVNDYIVKDISEGALSEFTKKHEIETAYHKRPSLSLTQTRIFLNELDNDPKWKNIFITLFGTGLRISELLGLTWKDVDFDNGLISVNHQLSTRSAKGRDSYYISLPKTAAGIRSVPMIDEVRNALRDEMAYNQRMHIRCLSDIDGYTDFVFISPKGLVRGRNRINVKIKEVVDKYNENEKQIAQAENREPVLLPRFSAHTTRHTFCTRLCEAGVQGPITQKIMGHSSITTTMDVYAEISEDFKKKEVHTLHGRVI